MSKDNRKTSKLAIAGLIFAVAAPCYIALFILSELNGPNEFLQEIFNVLSNFVVTFPFIALLLSIAGVVVSIKKNKRGIIPGIVGLILSIAEILLLILAIGVFITRVQQGLVF